MRVELKGIACDPVLVFLILMHHGYSSGALTLYVAGFDQVGAFEGGVRTSVEFCYYYEIPYVERLFECVYAYGVRLDYGGDTPISLDFDQLCVVRVDQFVCNDDRNKRPALYCYKWVDCGIFLNINLACVNGYFKVLIREEVQLRFSVFTSVVGMGDSVVRVIKSDKSNDLHGFVRTDYDITDMVNTDLWSIKKLVLNYPGLLSLFTCKWLLSNIDYAVLCPESFLVNDSVFECVIKCAPLFRRLFMGKDNVFVSIFNIIKAVNELEIFARCTQKRQVLSFIVNSIPFVRRYFPAEIVCSSVYKSLGLVPCDNVCGEQLISFVLANVRENPGIKFGEIIDRVEERNVDSVVVVSAILKRLTEDGSVFFTLGLSHDDQRRYYVEGFCTRGEKWKVQTEFVKGVLLLKMEKHFSYLFSEVREMINLVINEDRLRAILDNFIATELWLRCVEPASIQLWVRY